MIITVYTLSNLQINIQDYFHKDATKAIKHEIKENFKKNSYLYKRLLKAHPSIANDNYKLKEIKKIVNEEEK